MGVRGEMIKEKIQRIAISLEAGERLSLLVELNDDGMIKRLGSGNSRNSDHDLYMGKTTPSLFLSLLEQVSDDLLARAGTYRLPDPEGESVTLRLLFAGDSDKSELTFIYGSESMSPPLEVQNLVARAVELTEEWYQSQHQVFE